MSKRASTFQITDKNPNGPSTMNNDSPMRANAAQMANRKIKAISRRRGSPSPGPPSNTPPVSFDTTAATSFNFGASSQTPSQASSFAFGQNTPTASFPPANGVAPSNNFMSPNKSFGGFGGSSTFDIANGSVDGQTSTFSSTPFANNAGGFNFGSTQTSATPNPFGSIASTSATASNGSFTFGAVDVGGAAPTPTPSFAFGAPQAKADEPPSFGTAAQNAPFAFGQSQVPVTSTTSTSLFSSIASPTNANGFSFGSTAPTQEPPTTFSSKFAPSSNNTTTVTSPFGSNNASGAVNSAAAPSFSFGTTNSAKEIEPAVSNPISFGAPPSSAPSAKSAPEDSSSTSSTSFSFSKFSPLPSTAAVKSTATTPASKPPIFGFSASAPSASTSSGVFNFGAPAATPSSVSSEQPASNIFGTIKTPQPQLQPQSQPQPQSATPQSATNSTALSPFQFSAPKPAMSVSETPAIASSPSPQKPAVSAQPLASSKFASQSATKTSTSTTSRAEVQNKNPSLRESILRDIGSSVPSQVSSADRAQYIRDAKMYKLNEQIFRCFSNTSAQHDASLFKDYTSLFKQYIELASEFQAKPTGNQAHIELSTNSTSNPAPGSPKRKSDDSQLLESSKKAKQDLAPLTPSKFASTASSETAKKFDSFLNSSPSRNNLSTTPQSSPAKDSAFSTAGFTPFKPSFNASSDPAKTGPKISTDTQSAAPPSSGGFKPVFPSSTTSQSASGFKPTGVVSGANFLAQFGAKSKLTAEEEKKKRKAEDFDSDEDDEAEWEANYEKEQEAKRRKFEETRSSLAPPPKFDSNPNSVAGSVTNSRSVSPAGSVLDGPRPTGMHLFSHVSDTGSDAKDDVSDDEDDAAETAKVNGTAKDSLFSRITPREESSPSNGREADNPGDHTWKPTTPIKFGTTNGVFNFPAPAASAPPKTAVGNSLFSATKPQVTFTPAPNNTSNAAPSFSFGKSNAFPLSSSSSVLTTADTSRASTPVDSEAGSAAGDGNDPEDTPTSNPSNDLVNWDATKEGHKVLFEFEKAKAYKYFQATKDNNDQKHGWVVNGQGPVAILKNNDSGVVTILMKQSPSGKIVINTRLLPEPFKYTKEGKRLKFQAARSVGSGVDSYLIQVGSEALAAEMVKICEKNAPPKAS